VIVNPLKLRAETASEQITVVNDFLIVLAKGMEDEAAALALGNWARRNQIHLMFEVRRVLKHDVLYVLSRDKRD
jgi:hypothetical protein